MRSPVIIFLILSLTLGQSFTSRRIFGGHYPRIKAASIPENEELNEIELWEGIPNFEKRRGYVKTYPQVEMPRRTYAKYRMARTPLDWNKM